MKYFSEKKFFFKFLNDIAEIIFLCYDSEIKSGKKMQAYLLDIIENKNIKNIIIYINDYKNKNL